MYLEEGWKTFISDHSLQKFDFLVFRYDGHMQFNVRIFDKSACQRKDVFDVKPSQEWMVFEGGKAKCVTKNKKPMDTNHFSQPSQGQLVSSSRRSMRTGEAEAMEVVSSFRSRYLFFKTKLLISNVVKPFNLTIPIKFARDHLPSTGSDMMLQTEAGDSWKVHCYARPSSEPCYVRPSQFAFCGGWCAFVDDNDLKEGDWCIFELISDGVMKVYFHRC